ncbi:MAG: peptidase M15 [Alphaproteobacteria bacterium]|nr:peptidase M15 [Alphaproteobacteria bacterium]
MIPALFAAFAAVPEGWRDVASIENVALDVRYATDDNFVGRPLDGYGAPGAWLREVPWEGLQKAAAEAKARGYVLVVFDAYRPERASRDMVAWAETTGNTSLLRDGYVAARSGHNKGHTVDLTLRGAHGPLDMGTPYDTFAEAAHTANATGAVAGNRRALAEIMQAGGFRGYSKEWWHFSHGSGPYEPMDVPY